jgi:hypothetical protein
MEKVLAEVSNIQMITITGPTSSYWTFYDEVPEKIIFGFIRTQKYLKPRWFNYYERDNCYSVEEVLQKNKNIFYDGVNFLTKPRVYIQIYKLGGYTTYFDTLEQAERFVDTIVGKHDLKMAVIRDIK